MWTRGWLFTLLPGQVVDATLHWASTGEPYANQNIYRFSKGVENGAIVCHPTQVVHHGLFPQSTEFVRVLFVSS
jgi:hypothetical protein